MADPSDAAQLIAGRVSEALAAADLSAYGDLLHPAVHWGAPGDASPPCQNRAQVLSWYQRGRDAGTRARVIETVVAGDKILVGLTVIQPGPDGAGEDRRWQVLTVRDGLVADIRGYDDRADAAASAGLDATPSVHLGTRWSAPAEPLTDGEVELRLPVPGDAATLGGYASGPDGLEDDWIPLMPGASLASCEALIADWIAGWQGQPSQHGPAFAVQRASAARLIGQVWLADRADGVVELGYGIAPGHRRRGYATRATQLAAQWLLRTGEADLVELRIGSDNIASQGVASAAGFVPAGTVRCYVPATGRTYEDLRFILVRA
jgi:RimJ/RimL family protein N-acetyltransferase